MFPALVDADEHWNGAAIPRFRREVAGYVVDWVNETYVAFPGGSDRAYWDGRTVVVIESQWEDEPGYTPVRVEPDKDGRYWHRRTLLDQGIRLISPVLTARSTGMSRRPHRVNDEVQRAARDVGKGAARRLRR
ncbi:hypothetical protein ACIA5G_51345 [Amycolatopsis sp. NPDC051758]|uniref:hypothetical protein n=1 Tax=Amycolatopsis sp. NPDC051758 TaxID=3363935 RepID=UPI0037BD78A6